MHHIADPWLNWKHRKSVYDWVREASSNEHFQFAQNFQTKPGITPQKMGKTSSSKQQSSNSKAKVFKAKATEKNLQSFASTRPTQRGHWRGQAERWMPRNGAILYLSPELQRNALGEQLRTAAEGHGIFMVLFGENGAWHAYKLDTWVMGGADWYDKMIKRASILKKSNVVKLIVIIQN